MITTPSNLRLPRNLTPARVLMILVAIAIAVWFAVLMIQGVAERQQRNDVGQTLSLVFGVPVTVGSVQTQAQDMHIYDVRIFNPRGYGAEPAITINHITLHAPTIAGAKITAKSVRIDGIVASLTLYPDDMNLLALAGRLRPAQGIAAPDGTPWTFTPGPVTIGGVAVRPEQLLKQGRFLPLIVAGWALTPAAGTSPSMLAAQTESALLQRSFIRAAMGGLLDNAGPNTLRQLKDEFGVDVNALRAQEQISSSWDTKAKRVH